MDQPHGFLVRPSDAKRVPRYYVPASQGVSGEDADPQTPIYLVPADATRDSSNSARADSRRDLSSNLSHVRGAPVFLRSAPEEFKYAAFDGRPLPIEIPGRNAASSDSLYGGNRAVPRVVYEPLQGVRQPHFPRFFDASPSAQSSSLRPGYSEDQMWIPRQIPAQPSPYHTGGFTSSQKFVPGSRLEVPQYYVPLNSKSPQYGYSVPYHCVEGTGPAFNQPYPVDSQDYVDPRHASLTIPAERGRLNLEDSAVRGAREMQPVYTLVSGKARSNLEDGPIRGAREIQPVYTLVSGRDRSNLEDGPVSGAREMQPAYTLVSGKGRSNFEEGPVRGAREMEPVHTLVSGRDRSNLEDGQIRGAREMQPVHTLVSGRDRSNLDDGPARGAREMQPVYTLVPGKNIDASPHYRPDDGHYLVRDPDGLPVAYEWFDGGNAGINQRSSEVLAKQTSIVPVDFPVSDLAKVKSIGGDGHDNVYSKVFYNPTSGRFLVEDPRVASSSSSPYASTSSGPEVAAAKEGGKLPQRSNHSDAVASSRSAGPSAAGFPTQYLLPVRDPYRDSDASGGKEAAGARTPKQPGLIPVYPSSSTSNKLNAVPDDDKNSRISSPFYLVKPLAGSDDKIDTSEGNDSQQARASLPNATVKDDESARAANYRRLSESDKIMEIFEDGDASEKRVVVTRIIPVLSASEQHVPKKLENPGRKEEGVSEGQKSSDHVLSTPKNTENKESIEKSKSSEITATGNTKGTVRSTGKASKPKNDLMANIGKAFWSSKPLKEKRTVSEIASGVDMSSSKQRDDDVKSQKRDLDLPNVGNFTLSQPSQSSPKRSKSSPEAKSSDSEKASAPPSSKPEESVPVKHDALRSVVVDVLKSASNSGTGDEKSSQESRKIQVDTESKDRVTGVAGDEVVVVRPDLHLNFSITQRREQDAVIPSNTGGDGAAFESGDEADAQVSSVKRTASAQCNLQAQSGEAPVEEADSRKPSEPVSSGDGHDPVSLSPDKAATRIQARYRGHKVRQVDMFKSLRLIKKVQTKLQTLRSQVCTNEDVCNLLANPKERLKITESAMALLLELDTLQGVHPFVREMRKYVAQEIVEFQDRIDAVTKGKLILPSAVSSDNVAGSSIDTAEVLMDAETQCGVKEEQPEKTVASDFDTESKSEILGAVSGADLHRSETATTADAPSMEISEKPCEITAQTSPVEGTDDEAPSLQKDTSSGALSGDENIVPSYVNDRPIDVQSVSVEETSARIASVPDAVETVGLAPDVVELAAEEHSVAPPRVDNVLQAEQEAAYPVGASGEVDVNPTNKERSTETVQGRELASESREVDTNSTTIERSPNVHARESCEGPGSVDRTDEETVNRNFSTEVPSASLDAFAGYDSDEDKVVDGVIEDFSFGVKEDEAVTPLCDGKYDSGIGDGDGAITKGMPASLQGSVSTAGVSKDEEEGGSSLAELQSSCGNEYEDVRRGQISESEAESKSLFHGSRPPSEASMVVSRDDHGVMKASPEDDLDSGEEPSEVDVAKIDVSVESPEIIINDHYVEAAKARMNCEKAVIDLPPGCPSRMEVGVQASSASLAEESEVTRKGDEVMLSRKESELNEDASKESAEVREDVDRAPELAVIRCTETSQYFEHPSKVEMAVHDTSPLVPEETEVLQSDEDRLPKVELNGHDAVPREVTQDQEEDDSVLKAPDEMHPEVAELACENQLGRRVIEGDERETTNFTSIDTSEVRIHDDVFSPPKVVVQEDAPRESSEILGELRAAEVSDTTPESPSGLDVGVHDSLSTLLIADTEVGLRDEEGGMHNGVSGESREDTAVENADGATATTAERSESDTSEPPSECSSGEELVGHDDSSRLLVEETASMETSESLSENRVEAADDKMHESFSLSPEEPEVTSRNSEVVEKEAAVDPTILPEMDETAAVQAAAKSLKDEGASRRLSTEASCSSSYDEFAISRGEFEPDDSTRPTCSNPEDRDALLKQLTEENRRLQALFREIIQSNSEQKSTLQEMLERVERLEQFVKEQDQRKEKRKKNKKINRH